MKNTNSSERETRNGIGRVMRETFSFSIPATMVLTAVVGMGVAIAIDGCSSKEQGGKPAASTQQQSSPAPVQAQATPTPVMDKVVEVIKKKAGVKRPSTVTYRDSNYGVSFRYPRKYTLVSGDKSATPSEWPDPVPMNFAQPGGTTLVTLQQPGKVVSSYFRLSVNKGTTSEDCSKFAVPEGNDHATNAPADSNDDAMVATKADILGVEFSEVENVTDLAEARYYHRFEPGEIVDGKAGTGTCYEFALGVEDAPDATKPVDHLAIFDKLERVLTTVKIKSTQPTAETASVPSSQVASTNPQ